MYNWRHSFINSLIQLSREAISSENPASLKQSYMKNLALTKREVIYLELNKEMLNMEGVK